MRDFVFCCIQVNKTEFYETTKQAKKELMLLVMNHYGSSSGCFMCFFLGNPRWVYHIPEKDWSKDKFDKLLQDPETYYF